MTTLCDLDISSAMGRGELIRNGIESQVSGACYELRLGNVYYDLTESDKPIQVPDGGMVLIKPGHRVVLITHEEVDVPADMLARVVSKGSLFSVGLSPVATYADPGFAGNLGIVTCNISDRYIVLPLLESIAKVDFTRLTGRARRPYVGQHGFRSQIWPIKHELQKTHAEVSKDPRVGSEKEEGYRLLPQATAEILRYLEGRQRLMEIGIVVAILLNSLALFLVGNNLIDNVLGVAGNLVASVIVGIAAWYANRRR
jgi:dCTP deaminase